VGQLEALQPEYFTRSQRRVALCHSFDMVCLIAMNNPRLLIPFLVMLSAGALGSLIGADSPSSKPNTRDNQLTSEEAKAGWILLFDGKTLNGWMTSAGQPSKSPVEDGSLNPHKNGHYMLVHTQQWSNFTLSLDFKIGPRCNSGIFVRTYSLTPRSGKDVGFNGLEIAIDDTKGAGFHDTGAIYDLVKPSQNAMKPAGEWNHIEITCDKNLISVTLNGEKVTQADLSLFDRPNKRPDGSEHKFDIAFKDHPRKGYIGLQDHGSPCWFKNIKLRPLT
jgi:hypothetical protein